MVGELALSQQDALIMGEDQEAEQRSLKHQRLEYWSYELHKENSSNEERYHRWNRMNDSGPY